MNWPCLPAPETGVELLAPPEQAVKSIDNIIRAAINTAPSFIFFKVSPPFSQSTFSSALSIILLYLSHSLFSINYYLHQITPYLLLLLFGLF